jgi:hypothetical protein
MDAEIIKLIQSMASGATTAFIWYMVLQAFMHILTCLAWVGCFYYFGKGACKVLTYVENA